MILLHAYSMNPSTGRCPKFLFRKAGVPIGLFWWICFAVQRKGSTYFKLSKGTKMANVAVLIEVSEMRSQLFSGGTKLLLLNVKRRLISSCRKQQKWKRRNVSGYQRTGQLRTRVFVGLLQLKNGKGKSSDWLRWVDWNNRLAVIGRVDSVSYTHLRAHETDS